MGEMLSRTLAEWAAETKYEDLTPEAIEAAKAFVYDSLGCAFGGARLHDSRIVERHVAEKGCKPECTVFGSGLKTHAVEAAFLNALMIRAMDYNDIYWKQDPSHPSDLIPAASVLAEREGLSGKEMILGIVLGYEVEMRLCEFAIPGIRERGWHHATLTAYAAPLVAGRMLQLDADRMQHALGISACRHFTLGSAVAGKLSMMKNTVDPLATRTGVESAFLARDGYSGPENVLDGKEGMFHCLGPDWDTDALVGGLGKSWKITDCGMKAYPTEALTHTPITATLYLLRENDLAAEKIKEVRIETIARAADILSDPAKYDPRTKEAADHSLPYCIAAALVDHKVTPEQFEEAKIMEPRLREQLPKVKVLANEEFEKLFPKIQPCRVEIETTDGTVFERRIDIPKGDPRDPMTREELGIKFDALAGPSVSETRRAEIRETVFGLDRLAKAEELIRLCVADQ
ncbi:MAG: MmgE/PrpD family protein [Candidatus Eisenbacteria bacterium]|nr:MmgE/PrpD family protein [Candidatus Latescibacterota bacterium]MBD3303079.1 MmgE/PrpD family protein [Candidatus Eisenbacteria bacterium]